MVLEIAAPDVSDTAGLIVMEKVVEPVVDAASVAWTVKSNVPEAVAVPEIAPPDARLRPVGRAPDVTKYVYPEPEPPVAVIEMAG